MPVWCPECHAMLPAGLAECPRCGAALDDAVRPSVSGQETFWFTLITIGFVLIALLVPLAIGWVCVAVAH